MTKDLVMRIFCKYFFFKLLGVHDMRNSQIIHKKKYRTGCWDAIKLSSVFLCLVFFHHQSAPLSWAKLSWVYENQDKLNLTLISLSIHIYVDNVGAFCRCVGVFMHCHGHMWESE